MKISTSLFVTLKEEPADAEVRSHALMVRAGFIQQIAAGIYVYGPLLWRVLRKIETIVREELDRAGCQELLMPALQPRELWEESGRWERYVADKILYHFEDGRGREVCLGPTHEEVITNFVKGRLTSYKQLPQTLYQIQTKFRDEMRPRFGLMRGREFVMKDAYSFDATAEGMASSYAALREAYRRIFTRCGLRFTPVEADAGAIGDAASEEFMVDADTGEDAIAVCRSYGLCRQHREGGRSHRPAPGARAEVQMHKEPTPAAKSCEDLRALFPDLPLERMLKTILYRAVWLDREQIVAVMCRGDREINTVKLQNVLDCLSVELADEKAVTAVTGAAVGFAGPIGLADEVRLMADRSVEGVRGFLCGGNETDTHYLDVYFGRDLDQPETHELGLRAGRRPDGRWQGHDRDHARHRGRPRLPARHEVLGGHGLPIRRRGRQAPALPYGLLRHRHQPDGGGGDRAEPRRRRHDLAAPDRARTTCCSSRCARGTRPRRRWPQELHDQLEAAGIEVLWDDRKLGAGAKFKDADLVGIPLRVVVGRNASDRQVEWKPRTGGETEVIAADDVLTRVQAAFDA